MPSHPDSAHALVVDLRSKRRCAVGIGHLAEVEEELKKSSHFPATNEKIASVLDVSRRHETDHENRD